MYDRLAKEIRKHDDDHVIFFEPSPADSTTDPVGFDDIPGGTSYKDRSALGFHYYVPPNGNLALHFGNR
jgi:hypothetical protein